MLGVFRGGGMNSQSMEPYGLALLDFFKGDTSAKVVIHRDDGLTTDLPMSVFFRKPPDLSPLEQTAIDLCRGYVLDVGAGVGCHSLVLQEQGLAVYAIDISPEAVEIMLERGVKEVQCVSIFDFSGGPFDTILMMQSNGTRGGQAEGTDRGEDQRLSWDTHRVPGGEPVPHFTRLVLNPR